MGKCFAWSRICQPVLVNQMQNTTLLASANCQIVPGRGHEWDALPIQRL